MVYLSPPGIRFRLPSCKELQASPGIVVHVCKGRVERDEEFDCFYWERGGWCPLLPTIYHSRRLQCAADVTINKCPKWIFLEIVFEEFFKISDGIRAGAD